MMSTAHEVVELSGHLIDSWTLPRAWDLVMDRGGNFEVEEIRIGVTKTETSYIRLKLEAPNEEILERILSELQQFGATLVDAEDVSTIAVEQDGVLPARFYSTTNLPTQVRLGGQWVYVEHIEMDVAIIIDYKHNRAYCKPMHVSTTRSMPLSREFVHVMLYQTIKDMCYFCSFCCISGSTVTGVPNRTAAPLALSYA